MIIIGHHTSESKGSAEEIEKQGAFFSTHKDEDFRHHKFLGSGYYFWDNNIGMAHAHGQKNYKRKYFIFEAELNLSKGYFLDLAGDRIDMLWFQEIMDKLKEVEGTQEWTLAHYIEFLKKKGQFPYHAIRAIDTSINPKETIKFVSNRENHINLNPIFIICLLNKGKEIVSSFKHIKTFP